ncbi:MAG: hypothetical protein AAF708_15115, partial [Deinococcota bacterium]
MTTKLVNKQTARCFMGLLCVVVVGLPMGLQQAQAQQPSEQVQSSLDAALAELAKLSINTTSSDESDEEVVPAPATTSDPVVSDPAADAATDAPADSVVAADSVPPAVDVVPGLSTSPDAWPAFFSTEAKALLAEAETVAARAYVSYDTHTPDRPLWRETLQLARQARQLAPKRTEPVRFLAEIYLITEWYARSWETWLEYIDLGGELDSSALTQLSIAGKNIGYLSYQQENLDRAELFFGEVYELNPEDTEAL